ncbi:MAG TPA: hypothetical protein VF493_01930 [Terriglobales bacterium]
MLICATSFSATAERRRCTFRALRRRLRAGLRQSGKIHFFILTQGFALGYHLSPVIHLYEIDGSLVTEITTGWAVGYVYFNGQLVAEYRNGTTYLPTTIFSDQRGF